MIFGNRVVFFQHFVVAMIATAGLSAHLCAQGPIPDAPAAVIEAAAPTLAPRTFAAGAEHKFWDRENLALFAMTATLSAADFTVTRENLQSGGHELNPIVRLFGSSTAGLATNFVGETAGGIGLSYFFHRAGHHKLERVVSFVNIGASFGAVSYGLTHR